MKDIQEKYDTVINKNTFYFSNRDFEETYEAYINSVKESLLVLKNQIQNMGLKRELFEDLIYKKENGLKALLSLTGFSNEYLKRLITFIRVIGDPELDALVYKEKWLTESDKRDIKEWTDERIQNQIRKNEYFRKGIVNIFFEGSSVPIISRILPLFEVKKLSISKLSFDVDALVDTLIRYKEKGSYSGKKENNSEIVIEGILDEMKLEYEKGDLREFIENAPDTKRTIDFIIPNKREPLIMIESSYLVTTSSGQGDKSKTEIQVDSLIKEHYPKASFIGFVDGIGWYVRKNDLKRMVAAYVDVFTYHQDELDRFKKLLREVFSL